LPTDPTAQPAVSAESPARRSAAWLSWSLAARVIVAGVFLLAAWGKLQDPAHFADSIREYRIIPVQLTNGMAYILPWLEVIVAVVLLVGPWCAEARLLLLVMLVVFTAAKISAEVRGLKISCGCFGGMAAWMEKSLEGWRGTLLNFVLLGLLALDYVAARFSRRSAGSASAAAAQGARQGAER
jgi:uncharacterized membrane protein YphA (DoxX/SURF4 family)